LDPPKELQNNRRVFEELSFSRLIVVPLFFIDFNRNVIEVRKLRSIKKAPEKIDNRFGLEQELLRYKSESTKE